uniref:Uncharacterized protein n=1 Tax=Entomoneis sp. TaxID=186043 RepID=A0A2U9NQL0_9STRA|nr:hypothetical protein ycf42 [Entomoneis sp.]AWT39398.1 hypothetical protein ycf42 [Entomoneis sp.]
MIQKGGISVFKGILFLIDKESVIQYYTVNNLFCGRTLNKLLQILQSIQNTKKSTSQICMVAYKYEVKTFYVFPLRSKVYFKTLYSHKKN